MRISACPLQVSTILAASLAGILLLCGSVAAAGEDAKASDKKATPTHTIKVLLQERLAVVEKIHQLTVEKYKSGNANFDEVGQSAIAVLNARLELAESRHERLRILEEMISTAADLKDVATTLARAAEATQVDVLMAEAQLLQFEIALEREKKRGAKSATE